jgi:hypothetical protein
MPRGKKKAQPIDDRIFDLASFGETEFNIPNQMVDKTKRGYKLVSPLTKSGKLATRHGIPSIKLHPVHGNVASILSSKVDRYKLSEFVKQSKLQLEDQHKQLSALQEEIIEAEVKEAILELLQNVEIRNMVQEAPETLEAIVNVVEDGVRNEIVAPVASVRKSPRKQEEPKKKTTPKKSALQAAKDQSAKFESDSREMREMVKRIKSLQNEPVVDDEDDID